MKNGRLGRRPPVGVFERRGTASVEGCIQKGRKRIGQILIERGYATFEQVNEARRIQMYTTVTPLPPLGLILRELGYVTPDELEEALREQTK